MNKTCIVSLILLGALLLTPPAQANVLEIRIPSVSKDELRHVFPLELLEFVMNKSGYDYEIKTVDTRMNPSRIIWSLAKPGNAINIFIMGASPAYEEKFLPVRFPIFRGLLGYRLFLIHQNHQARFNRVTTLEDLQKMKGAQGIGWSDIAILEASGLQQHATAYDNIFRMIDTGNRIDYFSRGINEVFFELELNRKTLTNLIIENKICLAYPYALFFFCGKHDQELVRAVETGFENAYRDGSYSSFFYTHPFIVDMLARAQLDKRHIIYLPNPFLTRKTLNALEKYRHMVH